MIRHLITTQLAGVAGLALALWPSQPFAQPAPAAETYARYEDVAASGLTKQVLSQVIARGGKSKRYTDVLPLDGGTVGIAHFAVGGLAPLYRHMDTQRYFGRSEVVMVKQFAAACRPLNRSGNDTGWGCYSLRWWKDGMRAFVRSPESAAAQDAAWLEMMKPVVERALNHGWRNQRSLAIALGIANSAGPAGFARMAEDAQWDAERTLRAYVGDNAHRQRRRAAIDAHFPADG